MLYCRQAAKGQQTQGGLCPRVTVGHCKAIPEAFGSWHGGGGRGEGATGRAPTRLTRLGEDIRLGWPRAGCEALCSHPRSTLSPTPTSRRVERIRTLRVRPMSFSSSASATPCTGGGSTTGDANPPQGPNPPRGQILPPIGARVEAGGGFLQSSAREQGLAGGPQAICSWGDSQSPAAWHPGYGAEDAQP